LSRTFNAAAEEIEKAMRAPGERPARVSTAAARLEDVIKILEKREQELQTPANAS
jgi:hypothetical protein